MLNPSNCPAHPGVPLIAYGGQQWCRFCAANQNKIIGQYRHWFYLAQWAMVLSVPAAMVGLTALAPVDPTLSLGYQPRIFWWWLLFPTAFLASCLALGTGHMLIQLYQRASGESTPLLPWFHATHRLKDWAAVAFFSCPIYALVIFYGQSIPVFGAPKERLLNWFFARATLVGLTTIGAVMSLDKLKWVTPETLLPPLSNRLPYACVYGLLLGLLYLPVQRFLSYLAMNLTSTFLLKAALGIGIFALIFYVVLWLLLRAEIQKFKPSHSGPIPTTIAIVGPSNVGKTVFFSRAYSLLKMVRRGMINLEPSLESIRQIDPHNRRMEVDRRWPDGDVDVHEIPFCLNNGSREMMQFRWMDLPGGAFTEHNDPNSAKYHQYRAQRQQFDQHLVNSDAVAMLIDARDLFNAPKGGPFLHAQIYRDVAITLYKELEKVGKTGKGVRPVSLAIIITQCCRFTPVESHRFRSQVQDIADLWKNLAQQIGMPLPPVKIFYSSAVVTSAVDKHDLPKHPKPLISKNCLKPVVWLAAQTARANIDLVDSLEGFARGSELQMAVLRLESLGSIQI